MISLRTMVYLPLIAAILVAQVLAIPTPIGESHSCYTCRFTGLDGTCNHTQTCSPHQGTCITQVSYAEEDVWVTRACARLTICANAEENNADECLWDNPQSYGYEGKCSFCCSGDNCNSYLPANIATAAQPEDIDVHIQPRAPGGHTPGGPGKPGAHTPGGPGKPGGLTPGGPGKPGAHTPGGPGKPGAQTPGGPGKPGAHTPGGPGKPGGLTPGGPGKPGAHTPGGPGKPGAHTPGGPGKPGAHTPGGPGKPGGLTPGGPGKPGAHTPGGPGKPGAHTPGGPGRPGAHTPGGPGKPGGTTRPKPNVHCPICQNPTKRPNSPVTKAPATKAPATNPPATNPPATQAPATNPPATNPPATQAPATKATNPPATMAPATGGNNSPCHSHGSTACCQNHGDLTFDINIKVHIDNGGYSVIGQTGGNAQTLQIQTGSNASNATQVVAQPATTTASSAPCTTKLSKGGPASTASSIPTTTAPASTASSTQALTASTTASPRSATTTTSVVMNSQPATVKAAPPSTAPPSTAATPTPTSSTTASTSTSTTTPTTTSTTTPTTTSTTTTMSTSKAVVTKMLTAAPTPSGPTTPPFQCYACKQPDCSDHKLETCGTGSHYCMTTVDQSKNGDRTFTKGCVSKKECETKWWNKTAISSECIANMDDSPSGLPDMTMSCSFCCTDPMCNEHTQPTNRASWYIGQSLPPIPSGK